MSWNKGFTKENHSSVMKISQTMRRKKIDNFSKWRNKMRKIGKIPYDYPTFLPSPHLAEYIGVVLGDGNISKFPRTERIIISSNSDNTGFIKHYAKLTKIIFNKKPTINLVNNENCIRISLYQKEISKRLNIPAGNRNNLNIKLPSWIYKNKKNLIKLLKGLFEAEGSLSIHLQTYTYNFQFSNKNKSLLKVVENGLKILGYHPEIRKTSIRLRKKIEVEKFKKMIKFRVY